MTITDEQFTLRTSRAALTTHASSADAPELLLARRVVHDAKSRMRVLSLVNGDVTRVDGWASAEGLALIAYQEDETAEAAASVHRGRSAAIAAFVELVRERVPVVHSSGDRWGGVRTPADFADWMIAEGEPGREALFVVFQTDAGETRYVARSSGLWATSGEGEDFVIEDARWASLLAELMAAVEVVELAG